MKISVYEERPVKDKEQEFLLKLEKTGDYIYLKLVKKEEVFVDRGSILRINPDMTLTRCSNIDTSLGLPLNDEEQLHITGVDD